jgi:endonuclease YncB( thermonuclease family)
VFKLRIMVMAIAILVFSVITMVSKKADSSQERDVLTATQQARNVPVGALTPDALAMRSPTSTPVVGRNTDAAVVRRARPDAVSEEGVVAKVIDANTITVQFTDGGQANVRFIGVEAPDSTACFGPDSIAGLAELLPTGSEVWMQRIDQDSDEFGRLLRHVWRFDRGKYRLVDYELVQSGLAISHDHGGQSIFTGKNERAMTAARDKGVGLWAECSDLSHSEEVTDPGAVTNPPADVPVESGEIPSGIGEAVVER